MSIVWAVPVVAAAVATGLVVSRVRAVEEAAFGLWHEVARLSELRRPLARLRASADRIDATVEAFRVQHAPDADQDAEPGAPS